MPRVTAEQQASRLRVATLRWRLTEALGAYDEPNLTWEEVLSALNYMQASAINHLMNHDEPGEETHV